jgi:5-methylcytosine-specific restriction enzyme A
MKKLRTLRPRVATLDARIRTLSTNPMATPRLSDRSGHAWAMIRRWVLAEEPLCRSCQAAGRVSASVEVDHITPLSQGGTDDRANLAGICVSCHREKSAREAKQGRAGQKQMSCDSQHRSRSYAWTVAGRFLGFWG